MTPLEFIQTIAPLVQKYAPKYGIKVASPIIAQACLESGYGTSKKAKFHNYFGLKYRHNRVTVNNGYFTDGGSEQNPDGSYSLLPSSTAWYAFDNMEKGVEGYFQFINISNYAKLKTTSDPLTYLQYIKAANYATSKDYVQNVYKVIQKWGLTKYDTIQQKQQSNPQPTSINIIQKTSLTNTTAKANRDIKWIVLHYTAGTSSSNGAAANVASWFSKAAAQASADFIVDDNQIVQYNPDIKNRYCWSVGGARYSHSTTTLGGIYHGQCMNNNSISIEMCSRKISTKTLNASDQDWYFTKETILNAVRLTQYLMQQYNIDINHVIMHHMVTGKICPNPWCVTQDRLQQWYIFTQLVSAAPAPVPTPTPEPQPQKTPFLVTIQVSGLRIRSGPGTQYVVCGYVNKGIMYTIVEVQGEWGKLKSGAGWINISDRYVKRS